MSRFSVTDLPLQGLKIIQRIQLGDQRGFLSRLFCSEDLEAAGWLKPIVQINHTITAKKGTVRGMHYQKPPHAEMKLVSCIHGEVFDVAVDLRPKSNTFLQWHAQRLSAKNGYSMLIPEGFAHGFQALTDNVELIYCHTKTYVAEAEGGLSPIDPRLAIDWPHSITELSMRDTSHLTINTEFKGVQI